MQGNPPVRFDEGDVETESRLGYLGTAKRKRRQQIDHAYHHRATSLLYKTGSHGSRAGVGDLVHFESL